MKESLTADRAHDEALPLGLLAAAGFLSIAGARVVDPLLAVIARDFHTGVAEVSVVVAAFTLPYGINQLVLGPLGDRYGKLRVMLAALCGYALFTGACALAGSLAGLTVLRALAGASSAGLIPVALAYIGDAVPYAQRQVTMSRFLTGVVLAQILAGPIGGLFGEYVGWRGVFLLLAAAGASTAVALAVRLPHAPAAGRAARLDPAAFARLARRPFAVLLLCATLLEGAVAGGAFPFLAPYLSTRFGMGYAGAGLVVACFGLGAFVYTRGARRMLAWLGERGLVLGGGAMMAGALVVSVEVGHWPAMVGVELVLGLGYMMLHAVLQTRATELLPDARSTAVGAFVFMLFMGQSLGALAVGQAIGAWGYHAAFRLVAVGLVVVTLWVAGLVWRPAA